MLSDIGHFFLFKKVVDIIKVLMKLYAGNAGTNNLLALWLDLEIGKTVMPSLLYNYCTADDRITTGSLKCSRKNCGSRNALPPRAKILEMVSLSKRYKN